MARKTHGVARLQRAIALAVGVAPNVTWAAAAGSPAAAVSPPFTISATDVLNVGGGLTMVLLAVVAIAWLYGRVQGTRGGQGKVIQVVATQALGPKERVLVVDVAGEQLVLGVTAAGMRTLHVLQTPVEAATELPSMPSFAARLSDALRKRAT